MGARANSELVLVILILLAAAGLQCFQRKSGAGRAAPEQFVEFKDGGNSFLVSLERAPSADRIGQRCPGEKLFPMDSVNIARGSCRVERGGASNFARLAAGGKMSINAAGAAELELLPGVGQSRAGKIIALRQGLGGFESFAQLSQPKWFNEEMLIEAERFFTVTEP